MVFSLMLPAFRLLPLPMLRHKHDYTGKPNSGGRLTHPSVRGEEN